MEIRQTAVNSLTPAKNQLQTGRISITQREEDSKELKQHFQPGHTQQDHSNAKPPTAKRIADGLKQLEARQPFLVFSNKTQGYEAINPRNLNALNAYTEELNQPLQEKLSMLAGIDFFV